MTNHQVDRHEALKIMYHKLKTEFLQHLLRQMFETSWCFEKLTVKMVLPEDGDNEHQNASEYQSNSMTWCMKDSALSVGLKEDKINLQTQCTVYRILNSSLWSLWIKLCTIQCVLSHYLLPFKSQWYQAHLHTINYNVLLTGISESENKISQPACFTHNNFITFQAQCYKQGLNKFINILRQSENFGSQVSSGYQNFPSIAVKKKTFCLYIYIYIYMGDSRFKIQPTDMLRWWRVWCFVISPYSQIPGECLNFPYMWQLQFR